MKFVNHFVKINLLNELGSECLDPFFILLFHLLIEKEGRKVRIKPNDFAGSQRRFVYEYNNKSNRKI